MRRCYFWSHEWTKWTEPEMVYRKFSDGSVTTEWRQRRKCSICDAAEFRVVPEGK